MMYGSAEAAARLGSYSPGAREVSFGADDLREKRRAQYLFIHRILLRLALGAGNIFALIVVFRVLFLLSHSIGISVALVSALYALTHGIAFLLTPLAGRALRHGVRRALVYGTFASALSFVPLATLFSGSVDAEYAFELLAAFAVMQGIYRALYFVPYRTEVGTTRSPFVFAREALIALMPALAGYLLTSESAAFLVFAGIAAAAAASILPLLCIDETHEPYSWDYGETIGELLAKRNRTAVALFIFDGMQGAVLLFIWPLAVFLVLGMSFQALGAVLTATLCIAFLGRSLIRKFLNATRLSRSPVALAIIVFSSWIVRLGAASPIQVLAVDVYYNAGTAPRRFSVDPYAFEQAADGSHFVDEYTAIKEMGLAIGRIIVAVGFVLFALNGAWAAGFVAAILAAAFAAASSVIISHRIEKTAY
jgi:hypothetical protein